MDQKLYLSVDCGFDKFKCCIGDYLLAFSSKMIDVTNSINALSVADGDNTYIEYKGSVYMFGDSIDQIISMKSNLKMYAEELDSNRNKQRFKDRTFHMIPSIILKQMLTNIFLETSVTCSILSVLVCLMAA